MRTVKTKPLYRSVTFWSGIVVLVFLLWAGVDSMRRGTSGYVSMNGAGLGIGNQGGRIALFWTTGSIVVPSIYGHRGPLDAEAIQAMSDALLRPEYRIDPLGDAWGGAAVLTTRNLLLPHGFVIGLWLCLWLGLLLWRARRQSR